MEFRLVYEGPLRAAGSGGTRSSEKHEIRKVLHQQLVRLWQAVPNLRIRTAEHSILNAPPSVLNLRAGALSRWPQQLHSPAYLKLSAADFRYRITSLFHSSLTTSSYRVAWTSFLCVYAQGHAGDAARSFRRRPR